METITPKMGERTQEGFYDPMSYDGKTLRCCCGFELIKEDDNNWHCTGGGHVYRIQDGEVAYDKFGNTLLKTPPMSNDK